MLRKLKEPGPKKIRRGVSPQMLRKAMDMMLPPNTRANVNKRAMLATMLQGLMRGREAGTSAARDFEPT